MSPLHLSALHLLGLAVFILLLVQTARASYWKGIAQGGDAKNDNLVEQVNHARELHEDAIKETSQMREHLQRLHERAVLASSEPELFNELRESNDVLRSVAAIVVREGQDVNWDGLSGRISERLEVQHAMLYAVPVKD